MSCCSNEEEEEEISFSESDRHGYKGGSDDDDSEIGKNEHRSSSSRRRMGSGFGKVVVHQFTKAKKQVRRIRSRKSRVPKPKGKVVIVEGDVSGRSGCRFCFSRPKVLESPNGKSPTSDPNDPNFTHAMLTTLLDKNDFYSKECNPHLDLGEEERNVQFEINTYDFKIDSGTISLVVNACSIRDLQDNIVGVCFVAQDITAQKTMMDKFTRLEGDYKEIVLNLNPLIPPIFGTDEFDWCCEWNSAMAKLTRWKREEVLM